MIDSELIFNVFFSLCSKASNKLHAHRRIASFIMLSIRLENSKSPGNALKFSIDFVSSSKSAFLKKYSGMVFLIYQLVNELIIAYAFFLLLFNIFVSLIRFSGNYILFPSLKGLLQSLTYNWIKLMNFSSP